MGVSPTACDECRSADRLINCYALVTYIPGPLGDFLTDLRRELVPGCNLQSHVTFLPPRRLEADRETAWQRIDTVCRTWKPFSVELTHVEMFPSTHVAYLALGDGRTQIEELHHQLNAGPLYFDEPFDFHPHITLAQGIVLPDAADVQDLAQQRWREYSGPRSFAVDEITFVQNVAADEWVDLNELTLGR